MISRSRAAMHLPAPDLDATVAFFCERLGFRMDAIFPADAPAIAMLSGHGLRLRLDRDHGGDPGCIYLDELEPEQIGEGPTELEAPNGTRVRLVARRSVPELELPPLQASLTITRADATGWSEGRAGMQYRDLIPDRQGGRFIASHIRILEAGPVPDYVHFHAVRFQMIYCYKGWVRVVYEDQGPAFVLHAGDCVLQPPLIRHRVLECSAGLEVIEVGCPAEHPTFVEHDQTLPSPSQVLGRSYGGPYGSQRFVHHDHTAASSKPWRLPGFEARPFGFEAATDKLARAQVARRTGLAPPQPVRHTGELLFLFVLDGSLTLRCDGHRAEPLAAGDSCVIPPQLWHELDQCSDDVELLELCLPAEPLFEP